MINYSRILWFSEKLILACGLSYLLLVIFYRGLDFDGAFNTQAAYNLYHTGSLDLDYESIGNFAVQTRLPFQIINGFFLNLFGKQLLVSNFANIFFYLLLFLWTWKLSRLTNSLILPLGLLLISFNSFFFSLAFGGYGELPGLVLALWGITLLVKSDLKDTRLCFFGWLLVYSAILTKYVMLFALPIVFFVMILLSFRSADLNRKWFLKFYVWPFLSATSIFLVIFSYDYLSAIGLNVEDFISSLGKHAVYGEHYTETGSSYLSRLDIFWQEYQRVTPGSLILIKGVFVLLISSYLLVNLYASFKHKNIWSDLQIILAALFLFALLYHFWWFFSSTKPWFRRLFNGDVLLSFSIFIYCLLIFKSKFLRIKEFILALLLCCCLFNFSKNFLSNIETGKYQDVFQREDGFKNVLKVIGSNSRFYGFSWWQAPSWSFVLDQKVSNLQNGISPECFDSAECYYLTENVNLPAETLMLSNAYYMQKVYEWNKMSAYRIYADRLKLNESLPVFVNYQTDFFDLISGAYDYGVADSRRYKWVSASAKFPLARTDYQYFYYQIGIRNPNRYQTEQLQFSLLLNNKPLVQLAIEKGGQISGCLPLPVPAKFDTDNFVQLKLNAGRKKLIDQKDLAIRIYQIGFVSSCPNL